MYRFDTLIKILDLSLEIYSNQQSIHNRQNNANKTKSFTNSLIQNKQQENVQKQGNKNHSLQ